MCGLNVSVALLWYVSKLLFIYTVVVFLYECWIKPDSQGYGILLIGLYNFVCKHLRLMNPCLFIAMEFGVISTRVGWQQTTSLQLISTSKWFYSVIFFLNEPNSLNLPAALLDLPSPLIQMSNYAKHSEYLHKTFDLSPHFFLHQHSYQLPVGHLTHRDKWHSSLLTSLPHKLRTTRKYQRCLNTMRATRPLHAIMYFFNFPNYTLTQIRVLINQSSRNLCLICYFCLFHKRNSDVGFKNDDLSFAIAQSLNLLFLFSQSAVD